MNKGIITHEEASENIKQLSEEFAVIQNPDYIFPSFEIIPLASKIITPRARLSAVMIDMDGTAITAEELCLHSLEYMIRQISGKLTKDNWHGLDSIIDYPNIIGNSTTKNVEFLINRYNNFIKSDFLKESYFFAVLWTLITGKNEARKNEVKNNLVKLGCKDILTDEKLDEFISKGEFGKYNAHLITNYYLHRYSKNFIITNFSDTVTAAKDIYYQRYYELIESIRNGEGGKLASEIFGGGNKYLVEPMPGLGIFLALVKGWLSEDIEFLFEELKKEFQLKTTVNFHKTDIDIIKNKLLTLSRLFVQNPPKVALVTSSSAYEAEILLKEAFKILVKQIDKWKIPSDNKKFILGKFQDYNAIFDVFVTASDSNEIRLKPHRDLYSIALHRLGVPKLKFDEVIGIEDTESGTIAIRAAGIGLSIGLPFAKTKGHEFGAASHVVYGGLPDILLYHNLFMK